MENFIAGMLGGLVLVALIFYFNVRYKRWYKGLTSEDRAEVDKPLNDEDKAY